MAEGGSEAGHSADDGHDHEVVRGQLPKLGGAWGWPSGRDHRLLLRRRPWSGAPQALPSRAVAIWLAGFDVYKKGSRRCGTGA